MRNKLIHYVESIFEGIPNTPEVQELREEILQNTLDRYDEECAKGISEAAAYNTAVMSIGDTEELLSAYRVPKKKNSSRRVCVAIAIALYILCIIPPVIGDELGWPDALKVSLMFLMVAAATALIIASGGREKTDEPKRCSTAPETVAAESVQMKEREQGESGTTVRVLRGVLTPIYWLAAVGAFLAAGFAGYWHVAWVIFLAAGAAGDVITGIVRMAQGKHGAKKLAEGLLLLAGIGIYLKITAASGAWGITWLVFPICAALSGVLSGIFTLATGGKQ